MGGREARGQVEDGGEEEVEETASHHWAACTGDGTERDGRCTVFGRRCDRNSPGFWYLGQCGQQPLRVVQGGPAVRQTMGHVSQLLPDRRKLDLDVAQASPVQLTPAFQIAEHRQSLAMQILQGRSGVKALSAEKCIKNCSDIFNYYTVFQSKLDVT